ncbi:unnamed protein product, partial [Rotaria magnacalcarata]
LHVLDPASRTKQDSADTMIRVGRAIPKLLSNAEIDRIRHEFMMYAVETIDQSWYIKNKYHDSDGVGSPHRVPIKIDMIRAVQKSKLVYNQEQLSLKSLADRKKEQSEKHEHTNEEMKKLIDRENQLLSKQKGLHDKKKKTQLLVGEGRQRLDNALKKSGYYIDAQTANVLIGAGDEQVKLISDELFKITDELLKIQSTPLPVDAFVRLTTYNDWNNINWLIDTKKRLNQYLYYAQQEHIRIKINLEIDVGLHRGGFEIAKDFVEAVEIIKQNSQYIELTGLMGYDGHVPYVPFYINKERSIRKTFVRVQELYGQFVDELKKHYGVKAMSTMTFNSGGSHTYFYYSDYKSITPVNDIAVGSGFLAPKQFSDLIELGHQPALFLSAPVLKKIESSKLPHAEKLSALVNIWDPNLKTSYFMLSGGWPGELVGPVGLKRNHWWDENDLGYTNQLPNQSILSSSDENNLNVSDFVFYHPWEGDGMLCFKKLVLYKENSIVGEWDTYKGGN